MREEPALLTTASSARRAHLDRQQRFLEEDGHSTGRFVAWLDHEPPPPMRGITTVHVPPGASGLRVGAGRNAAVDAASRAGYDRFIFLDVDCLPGAGLIERYSEALSCEPDALLCGPVTYLPEGTMPETSTEAAAHTAPHRARPDPIDGQLLRAAPDEYDLFWSLSFAITRSTWDRIGGFFPSYEGYGAEDTDFAASARDGDIAMHWVGGAHAYHQWHPTHSPPVQHLDDILRNGGIFARRWGRWPMAGWLTAFQRAGLVERSGDGWIRIGAATA